jgi:hypothetical protein
MSGNTNYEAGLRLMALHQDVVGLRIGVEETKKQVDALTGELHAHTVMLDTLITVIDDDTRARLIGLLDQRGLSLSKREDEEPEKEKEGNSHDANA